MNTKEQIVKPLLVNLFGTTIDLSNKDLGTRMVNGIGYNTIIKGCDITSIKLDNTNLANADLSGCTINGVIVTKAQLANLGALNTDTIIGIN